MNVRVESAGACRKSLYIEVPADQVRLEQNEVTTLYLENARIPGFRVGKAPREIVRRRYAKEIAQEVKDRLVPKAYQEAIKQEKLQAVAILDVSDKSIEEGQPFAFTVTLDVFPDFKLPAYTEITVEAKTAPVTDDEVEQAVQGIRERAARYDDITNRPVKVGDMVQVDYKGTIDGEPILTLAPKASGLGEIKDFWLIADPENEFLPGFAKGLEGASIGDQRTVEVEFPEKFTEPVVAGKKATYAVTVKGLRQQVLPEVDAAFAKQLGLESVDQLRERLKQDLANTREMNEKRRQQGEVLKQLVEQTTLELPESVVQKETQQEIYDLVRQTTRQGISGDVIETKKEEIFDTAAKNAAEKVKIRYILRRIAQNEKITITEAEYRDRLKAMSMRYQIPVEKVAADIEKNHSRSGIEEEILMTKTLQWVHEKANVKAA